MYWRAGAETMLSSANPDKFLHDELAHAFSVLDSPVWMDSSTEEECRALEEALGGPERYGRMINMLRIKKISSVYSCNRNSTLMFLKM